MYFKHLLISALLFCAISNVRSTGEDDDFDGVTVEEEVVEPPVIEVPYESPVPSDKKSVYLADHFDDAAKFEKKWIKSQAKKEGISEEIAKYDGVWSLEAPQKDGLVGDLGLVLKSKAKHAAISAKLDRPFVFMNKPLVVQYEVLLQDGQECGGAYLKLLSDGPETKDLKVFHDKTPYTIMFGPDKCGNDHKLHFIFRHKNPLNGSLEEKHCRKPKDRLEDYFRDKIPHLYTLVISPDNTYEVWIDKKIVNSGSLLEDFTPAVNPPAEIDDPKDIKPEDWDEREKIPDPEATKPDDWDETAPPQVFDKLAIKPEGWLDEEEPMIPDPEAQQPEDWDAEMDGEWEAPLIDNPNCATAVGCGKWEAPLVPNPAFKGKWRAPLIDNPNYKGKWKPRRIPNPDFFEDPTPFRMTSISAVGFELWSMSQDILFDNIIITDELSVANKWSADSYELKRKKIAKDAVSLWGRAMKAMNYRPGWWAIYFVYCLIPLAIYVWYLKKRVKEESFVTRLISYAEENPWLWAVYILVLGLPIILIFYCCCSFGNKSQEREEMRERDEYDAATIKKTDEETKDDEPLIDDKADLETEDVDNDDEVDEVEIDEKMDERGEKESDKDSSDEKEEVPVPDGQGDAPRKRKVRKE